MAGPYGPYERETDTYSEPMPAAVKALHDADRVRTGDPEHLVRDTVMEHLAAACAAAGVELGDYDRRVLLWLAGWESQVVQVLIGMVTRAHAAGRAELER